MMSRINRCSFLVTLLLVGAALSHPAGDAAPGSQKKLSAAGKPRPTKDWKTFLGLKNQAVDLRGEIAALELGLRNQAPRGTCTVFATTFLIEFLTARQKGVKGLDLSEEYLNAVANLAANDPTDGSSFDQVLAGYEQYGIVSESKYPYQQTFDPNRLKGPDAATKALLAEGKKNRGLAGKLFISPNQPNGFPGLTDEQFAVVLRNLDKGVPVGIGYGGDADN